jgi:uncharacterized protein YybS (DUF2232 family)
LTFFFLVKYGIGVGNKFILAGALLALIPGLATGSFDSLIFSYSLLPTGYVIAASGLKGESPTMSGLKGAATLAACWLGLIYAIGAMTGISPYSTVIATLNAGIDEALQHYRVNETIDADALVMLESTLYQMKVIIPVVMPGIFLSCTLFSTWITMVFGNRLAERFCDRLVWQRYRTWQLPDKLIWLVIAGSVVSFLPTGALRPFGINLLIVLATVYSFQGFSICVFYMNKWNVPLLLRSFLYVMIIFQSFGTILLLALGIFDTWFDFRKLSGDTENSNDTANDG